LDEHREPSGLLAVGNTDPLLFKGWIIKLCAKLTAAFWKEVYDAEVWPSAMGR
jgi:hypothetical protein